jgi:methylated-DNA-[protein]-cysteine S-methyltransferase
VTEVCGVVPSVFGPAYARLDGEGRLTHLEFNDPRAAGTPRTPSALRELARQLAEYGAGERRAFDLRLAPVGSGFQHAAWAALRAIPFGETMSYGALARALGRPGAARAVGRANATNPIALIVPCHRVIGADGSLTGYAGGVALKARMLAFERAHAGRQLSLLEPP